MFEELEKLKKDMILKEEKENIKYKTANTHKKIKIKKPDETHKTISGLDSCSEDLKSLRDVLENDESLKKQSYSNNESMPKYENENIKRNDKALKIELTPKSYLKFSEEIEKRDDLIENKIQNPKFKLVHEQDNYYDDLAIKVICDDIFIGYVLKRKNRDCIDKYCFENQKMKDLNIIFYNNQFKLILKNDKANTIKETTVEKRKIYNNDKDVDAEAITSIEISKFHTKYLSNIALVNLLEEASEKDRYSLTKEVYGSTRKSVSSIDIQEEISSLGGDSLANLGRWEGNSYLDIVLDIAKKLEISNLPDYTSGLEYCDKRENLKYSETVAMKKGLNSIIDLEDKILIKILEKHYDTLDTEKKEIFNKQLNIALNNFNSNTNKYLSGTAGLLALSNLGGFATYTFITTAMSALSFGALPFGAYMATTAIVGALLGPAGWSLLGIGVLLSLSSPSPKRLLPIVLEIALIRKNINQKKNAQKFENTLNSIELPTFEKIKRYCTNLAEDGIVDYLTIDVRENGKMYKALIYDAFDQFIYKLNGKNIDIIDWGSGQGLASLLALDYIREKQLDINIEEVTLIEENNSKLSRAKTYINLLKSTNTKIKVINKSISDLIENDLIINDNIKINLFTNCNALKNINPDTLPFVDGYYIFLFSEKCDEGNKFLKYYNDIFKIEKISTRDSKIGRYQRYEQIFKIDL